MKNYILNLVQLNMKGDISTQTENKGSLDIHWLFPMCPLRFRWEHLGSILYSLYVCCFIVAFSASLHVP